MSVFDALGASEHPPMGLEYGEVKRDVSVTGRISQKWQPTSGSVYSGLNSRVITFRISSSMLADMESFWLSFQVKTPRSWVHLEDLFPLAMIESARLNIGGAAVENIQNFSSAVKPLVYHTASADWLSGPGSVTCGSWLYRPSNGIGLEVTGSNGVQCVTDSTSIQIANAAVVTAGPPAVAVDPTTSLGFHAASPYAFAGSTFRSNSFAGGLEWTNLGRDSSSKFSGRTNAGVGLSGRTMSIPLGLIFGAFRMQSYLPLMSCGSIDISLTLAAPNRCLIVTNPLVYGAAANTIVAASLSEAESTYTLDYTLSNVTISGDLLQVAPSTAQKIMAMTSGDQGISFTVDTLVSTSFPTQPGGASSHSFTVSRPLSNMTAQYIVAQSSVLASSEFACKSNYVLGSRFVSSSITVGGLSFPSQTTDSTSQAYLELRKAITRGGANIQAGSAITWPIYNSQYASPYGAYNNATRGSACDVTLLTDTTRSAQKYRLASGITSQTPSCFMLGQSFSRILSGSSLSVSGINSRLSSYVTQTNLSLVPFRASPNNSDPAANPASSTDSALLDTPLDFTVTQSATVLVKLANDSVSVSD